MRKPFRLLIVALAAQAWAAASASATPVNPAWTRGSSFTTYQAWDVFSNPPGPNAPNSPGGSIAVDAAPFNPNGTGNVFDTSGQSFITSGGNIYSPTAATHINVAIPDYALGNGYFTTVLFQTRTQGNEPIYAGPGGYRLTYTDGSGAHTVLPASGQEQFRQTLGGFGGDLVDYAAVFDIPASVSAFQINVDASDVSMSFDRAAVDTITTRANAGSPLLAGMNAQVGFAPQAVPEPGSLVALAGGAGLLLRRRGRSS